MRKILFKIMRTVLACFSLMPSARAATWYVATNGAGQGTGGWVDATNSLPGAVAASVAGETVLVSNGVYQLSAQLAVIKAITLQSLNGRTVTEIRGDFPNSVFNCITMSAGAIVDGFTIANGYETNAVNGGAGVYMLSGTLRNCRVTGNYLQTPDANAQRGGAGVYMLGATVSNCLIDGNILTNLASHSASGGAGVHMNHADALLADCEIRGNNCTNPAVLARGYGGGIMLRNGAITRCLIISNAASGAGGGFRMNGGKGLMLNSTSAYNFVGTFGGGGELGSFAQAAPYEFVNVAICGNTAQYGGGVYFSSTSTFHRCHFEDNQSSIFGGGVLAASSAGFSDCVFRLNQNNRTGGDAAGGGLYVWSGGKTGIIARCQFESNAVTVSGGSAYGGGIVFEPNVTGVWLVENCEVRGNVVVSDFNRAVGGGLHFDGNGATMRNSLIRDNSVVGVDATLGGVGGGVSFGSGGRTNVLENCTIAGNYALRSGGGIYYYQYATVSDVVRNAIVHGNTNQGGVNNWHFGFTPSIKTNVTYTCTPDADMTWGAGCIADAPAFLAPASGNYRLIAGSPCIDAGRNLPGMDGAVDLDGQPRIDRISRRVDMGCYERLFQGTFFYAQ